MQLHTDVCPQSLLSQSPSDAAGLLLTHFLVYAKNELQQRADIGQRGAATSAQQRAQQARDGEKALLWREV